MELYSGAFTFQKMNYIHNNPVEAGIVERPEHYLYSSAKDYFEKKMRFVGFGIFVIVVFSNELQTHYNNPKVLILMKVSAEHYGHRGDKFTKIKY